MTTKKAPPTKKAKEATNARRRAARKSAAKDGPVPADGATRNGTGGSGQAEGEPGTGRPPTKESKAPPTRSQADPAPQSLALPRIGQLQRSVLVALPCFSVTELAERLDVTRPSASRALHSMLAVNLVQSTDGQAGWKSGWELTTLGIRLSERLSLDSVRRVLEAIHDRPRNLPADAERILADTEADLTEVMEQED